MGTAQPWSLAPLGEISGEGGILLPEARWDSPLAQPFLGVNLSRVAAAPGLLIVPPV